MEQKEFSQDAEIEEVDMASEAGTDEKTQRKNLVALVILLAGLFAGSLFVDVAQLVSRSGFSITALKNAEVVEAAGKTWVSYPDPKISVQVITDASCGEQCNPDQAIVWLRRAVPTLQAVRVEAGDPQGEALIEKTGVVSLPAFVFSKEIDQTDFYTQAGPLFTQKDDVYVLNTTQLGIPAGKWLQLPEVTDADAQTGAKDAKVKIVEFSDFQCPYCKAFAPIIRQVAEQYKDKVLFVYKQFPLTSIHPYANTASLASECANEQGKFFEYHDRLFSRQEEWSKAKDPVAQLKSYAFQTGLNASQFNKCLDDKKYQAKVDADLAEGAKFGISGTPGTFVNGQFIGGLTTADQVKKIIDEELAK